LQSEPDYLQIDELLSVLLFPHSQGQLMKNYRSWLDVSETSIAKADKSK